MNDGAGAEEMMARGAMIQLEGGIDWTRESINRTTKRCGKRPTPTIGGGGLSPPQSALLLDQFPRPPRRLAPFGLAFSSPHGPLLRAFPHHHPPAPMLSPQQFSPPFPLLLRPPPPPPLLLHLHLLLLLANQFAAELVSQSVTNLPAPSPAESYQFELLSSQPVNLALSFRDLFNQKRYGNRMDQCPCIVRPGSKKCVVYDGRYQAALTEEAMLTFVDNSMDPRIFEQRMGAGQITYWTLECHSEECRQCVGMLTVVLRHIGLLRDMPQFPFAVPSPSQLRPFGCPRLRISRSIPSFSPPPTPPPSIGQLISAGAQIRSNLQRAQRLSQFDRKVQQALSMNRAAGGQPLISLLGASAASAKRRSPARTSPSPSSSRLLPSQLRSLRPSRPAPIPWVDRDIRRKVRQAGATAAKSELIIGERYVINCVERGEAETDQTDLLNLCTACWTWRQLPEDYFPRLINELVCQENDFCLSGWGICHQRYRNFDVLQRVVVNGQEEWRPTTISAASCCDCKVRAGSQAHSLVVGGKS